MAKLSNLLNRQSVAAAFTGSAARLAISFVAGPVLSRLAGPSPYGLVAPALNLGQLGKLAADSGFTFWTLSAKEFPPNDAANAFRSSVRLSCLLALFAGLGSVAVGAEFNPVHNAVRFLVAASVVLFGGASSVPSAWLQRSRRFATCEWANTVALAATTLAIVLPLAFLGQAPWAVILNQPLQLGVAFVILHRLAKLPTPQGGSTPIPSRYKFGSLGVNVADYFSNNLDVLMLGVYLGIAGLGIYTRALFLAALPASLTINILHNASMVGMQAKHDDRERVKVLKKPAVLLTASYGLFLLAPLTGLDVPGWILGRRFAMSPSTFGCCLAGQALFYISALLGTLLVAIGRQETAAKCFLFHAVVLGSSIFLLRPVTLDVAMRLYLANGTLRAFLLVVVTVYVVRARALSGQGKAVSAEPVEPALGDIPVDPVREK